MTESTQAATAKGKLWLIPTILVASVLIVTLLIPLGISYGIEDWVKKQGGESVSIVNVDFNPFTATLELHQLTIRREGKDTLSLPSLKLKMDWWPLWRKELVIRNVDASDLSLQLAQNESAHQLLIGGVEFDQKPETASTKKSSWVIKLNRLSLQNASLRYQRPDLELFIRIDQLGLINLSTTDSPGKAQLTFSGSVDGAPLSLNTEFDLFTKPLSAKGQIQLKTLRLDSFTEFSTTFAQTLSGQLNLDGHFSVVQNSDNMPNADYQGHISLNPVSIGLEAGQIMAKAVAWDGAIAVTPSNATFDGTMETKSLRFDPSLDKLMYQHEGFHSVGKHQIDFQNKTTLVESEGVIDIDQLTMSMPDRGIDVVSATNSWDGLVKITMTPDEALIDSDGGFLFRGLQITDTKQQLVLFASDSIKAEKITSSRDVASIDNAYVEGFTIGKVLKAGGDDTVPMISGAKLLLETVHFDSLSGIKISKVNPQGVKQHIVRLADGTWSFDVLTGAIERLSKAEGTSLGNEGTPTQIQINHILLSGKNVVTFEDQTTTPPYKTQFKPNQLTLTGLDSEHPEKPGKLNLQGVLDTNTTVDLQGGVALFLPKPAFNLKGQIKGLELPPLSAYTVPLMGYQLQSGEANADLTLEVNKGVLKGNSDLQLHQLEVKPINQQKMAALQKQLSIPLETAIGMLKDKHNRIQLALPISGALDQISVDPSDAINQAVGRAMKKGAKTYLAAALFPFGTLLTLVELVDDAAAKVKLDPISFEEGATELDTSQYAYLEKVAGLLEDRNEVHIRVCGVTVEVDRQALKEAEILRLKLAATKDADKKKSDTPLTVTITAEQLEQLAIERVQSVENHMTTQYGISVDRLINCKPRIEGSDKEQGKPRVDLLI